MTQVICDNGHLAIACERCSEVIEDLSQVVDYKGLEYCTRCAHQVEVADLVKLVIEASLRVNTDSKYCAFVNYMGHVHTLDVYLTESKEKYANHVARSSVNLHGKSAVEELTRIHHTLLHIAAFNELPEKFRPSRYGRTPEVMSA